jgi:hypothetical protein
MRSRPNPVDRDPFALEGELADRLLSGAFHHADAPPEYAGVAAILSAAAARPRPSELAGEEEARAAFRVAIRPSRAGRARRARGARGAPPCGAPRTVRARGGRARIRSLRVAIVLALVLLIVTGAALATGAVPAPSWPFPIPGAVHFHGRPDPTTPKHERGPTETTGCERGCPATTTHMGAEERIRSRQGPPGQADTGGEDHRAKPPPGRGGWGGSNESTRGESSRAPDRDSDPGWGRGDYGHDR